MVFLQYCCLNAFATTIFGEIQRTWWFEDTPIKILIILHKIFIPTPNRSRNRLDHPRIRIQSFNRMLIKQRVLSKVHRKRRHQEIMHKDKLLIGKLRTIFKYDTTSGLKQTKGKLLKCKQPISIQLTSRPGRRHPHDLAARRERTRRCFYNTYKKTTQKSAYQTTCQRSN